MSLTRARTAPVEAHARSTVTVSIVGFQRHVNRKSRDLAVRKQITAWRAAPLGADELVVAPHRASNPGSPNRVHVSGALGDLPTPHHWVSELAAHGRAAGI